MTLFFSSFQIFNQRFPFDWKNPIGFLVATVFEYMTMTCEYTFVSCSFTFGFGNFFFIVSATQDLKNNLKSINELAVVQNNRRQTLKRISEFIRFHSSLKRLSYYFCQMNKLHKPYANTLNCLLSGVFQSIFCR